MIKGCAFSRLILLIVCIGKVIISATLILSPDTVDVMENETVVLTCTSSAIEGMVFWQTTEYPYIPSSIVLLDNGTCETSGFIKYNNTMYMGNCFGKGVFTVTILNTDETQHNTTWRCRTGFSDISNDVTVFVKVPLKYVNITTPSSNVLMLKENQFYSFTCQTSYSRPAHSVQWFRKSGGKTERLETTSSDILTQNEKQFVSAKSVLNISFGREKNGGQIYCNGSNDLSVAVSSHKIILNVTFPPQRQPIITGAQNRRRYQIVEYDVAHLSCTVSDGNPLANLVWFCFNGDISEIKESNTVTSSITWTALRNQQNTPCVCVAEHMLGNRNTSVIVEILYRAQVKAFYVWNQIERNILTVNETEKVTFMCEIDSKPSPSADISVNGNTRFVSQNNTLVFTKRSIKCTDFGNYTCSGFNDYNNGVQSTKSLVLYVNCSPRPSPYAKLKENVTSTRHTSATLSFTAIAYPEPGTSGYIWTYINESERVPLSNSTNLKITRSFLQSNLTIRNVTEGDYGRYVLQIINKVGVYEQWFNLILKEKTTVPTDGDPENNSELVAGITVTSVTIAVLVLIVISVYLFRKRLKQSHSQKVDYDHRTNMARMINESSLTYGTLGQSQREGDLYSQLPATYEQLDNASRDRNVYSEMEDTKHDMSDYVNIRI